MVNTKPQNGMICYTCQISSKSHCSEILFQGRFDAVTMRGHAVSDEINKHAVHSFNNEPTCICYAHIMCVCVHTSIVANPLPCSETSMATLTRISWLKYAATFQQQQDFKEIR